MGLRVCGVWFVAILSMLGCKRAEEPTAQGNETQPQEDMQAQTTPPSLVAQFTKTAPTIDGDLSEDAWGNTPRTDRFVQTLNGSAATFKASARVLYDDDKLYFAVEVQDDDLRATDTEHDAHLWKQDCVELMIDPDGDGLNYFELQVSPKGVVFDTRYDSRRKPQPFGHTKWQSQLEQAVVVAGTLNDANADRGYTLEAALPFAALQAGATHTQAPIDQSRWRVNFYVMNSRSNGQRAAGWSAPLVADFHVPSRFGHLIFDGVRLSQNPPPPPIAR